MQIETFQDWESASVPTTWSADTGLATSTAASLSGLRSLSLAVNSAGVPTAYFKTADANSGNVVAAHYVRIDNAIGGIEQDVNLFVRGTSPSPFSGSTYYAAQFSINNQSGSPGLTLLKRVAGTQTAIANPGGTFAAGAWYYVELQAIGTALQVICQRLSDGQWLTSLGAWQSAFAVAISATDAAVTGSGLAGVVFYAGSNAGPNYSDSFSLRTAGAVPSAATLISPAYPAAYANHRTQPITIRGVGVTTNTTVTLSDGGAGGVWQDANYNEITSVTLTSGTPNATVYYRPPYAAASPINLSASSGGVLDDSQAFATCLIRAYPTLATPDPTQLSFDQVAVRRPSSLWAPFPYDLSGPFLSLPGSGSYTKIHDVGGGTESLSAGVYSRLNAGSENEVWWRGNVALPNPGYNAALTVNGWGGGTTDAARVGVARDEQNYVCLEADNHAGTVSLVKCNAGTVTTLATATMSLPAGTQLLFQVAKEWAIGWYKRPTDSSYQFVGLGQVSTSPSDAFAWETIATLAAWFPFFGTDQAANTAIGVTGFTLGHAGALALQNCRFVRDETTGAPLLSADGATAWITSNGGMNSSTIFGQIDSSWLTDVFSFNVNTYAINHVARLWFSRNGRIAADLPASIGYNSSTRTWTVISSDWPDYHINGYVDVYAAQTTADLLSGVNTLSPTALKLPNSVAAGSGTPLSHYDTSYYVSGGTYHLAYIETTTRTAWSGFYPAHATASSLFGTWAQAWADTTQTGNEGAVLASVGGSVYQLTGSAGGMNAFAVANGASVGALNNVTGGTSSTTFVTSPQVAPHPCLLSLPGETSGTTRYVLIAFDSTGLNPDGNGQERWTWGNGLVFEAIERRSASEFAAWTTPASTLPTVMQPAITAALTALGTLVTVINGAIGDTFTLYRNGVSTGAMITPSSLPASFAVQTAPATGATDTYTTTATDPTHGTVSAPSNVANVANSLPVGRYSDLSAWDDFAGTLNVEIYSDKDGSGTQNNSAIQRAMNYADEQIDQFFGGFYVTPLVFNSGQVSETVRTWATIIGLGKWLYFGRGQYDAKGASPLGDRFSAIVDRTYKEMDEYRGTGRLLPCAPLTGTGKGTAVVAVPPTVNADGSPYRPWPRYGWWGYRWGW